MADVEYKFIDNTVLADEVIGHANISSISDGTLRGAVKKINTDLDGVKEHLTEVDKSISTNLLKPTITSATTINGITITPLSDGTFNVNGTLSGSEADFIISANISQFSGNMKLVGCPSGGSTSSYFMQYSNNANKTYIDVGDGITVQWHDSTTYPNAHFKISIRQSVSNLIFKPMLTKNLNATVDDFVQFTGTTGKLNSDFAKLESEVNSSLGNVTNMLKPTLKSQVVNGITCTENNGTYTLNGTASEETSFQLSGYIAFNKQLKLVGCPNGASDNTYTLLTSNYDSSKTWESQSVDYGEGVIIPNTAYQRVFIKVRKGVVLNNLVFKPMITTNLNAKASDFVAYTGSTGKLTSDVAEFRNSINIKQFDFNIGSSTQESATVGGYRNVATFSNISNELTGKTVIPVIITTKDATSRPFPAYCTKTSLVIMSTSSLASTAMTGTFLILG